MLDEPGDGIRNARDLPRELDDVLAEHGDAVGDRAHGRRALRVLALLLRLLGCERGLQIGEEALALLRRFEGLDQVLEGLGIGASAPVVLSCASAGALAASQSAVRSATAAPATSARGACRAGLWTPG